MKFDDQSEVPSTIRTYEKVLATSIPPFHKYVKKKWKEGRKNVAESNRRAVLHGVLSLQDGWNVGIIKNERNFIMTKTINNIKKKVMIMAMVMILGVSCIPVHATTITSNTIKTSSAYTLYIRKTGVSTELGTMYLNKTSSYVSNTFTASTACESVTVYVSNKDSNYSSKKRDSIKASQTAFISKNVSKPKTIYGYCSVSY